MALNKIIKFLEYLHDYPNEYIIIGGTACEISEVISINSFPQKYKNDVEKYVSILSDSQQILKNRNLNNIKIEALIDRYKKIFNVN